MSKNTGQINLAFLTAIDADAKAAIIDSIAKDYGTPSSDIWEEVTAIDAHNLLDYMKEPYRSGALALMYRYGFKIQGGDND